MPLALALGPANRNDHLLLAETLDGLVARRPSRAALVQHLCLDLGYDDAGSRREAAQRGYVSHIRSGSRKLYQEQHSRKKARRWVVEVVFTQMTKADVLARGARGQHVADLDLGVGDDHAVDEQQHELPALLEGRRGQPVLHPRAERLQ